MSCERCVVVGAGSISKYWFEPLVAEKCEIAGIVDIDPGRAKAQAAKYAPDAKIGSDLKAILKTCKPEFVVDLTIPEAHCAVTCTALAARCHVIGEKPMAASMAQARKMVRASEQSGKMYMVSQSRRWQTNEAAAAKAIVAGRVGDVTTVNCDFYIGVRFGGGFREQMPSPLILDMAIHHFDLMRYMTGLDPVAVYTREFDPKGSWFKGDAAATCVFEMSNGALFTYRGSWCSEGCQTSWNGEWRIIGTGGTIVYENDQAPHGQSVVKYLPKEYRTVLKDFTLPAPALKQQAMHGALREMLTFLRTGKKPQTECHDNIKSLAMVLAAIESSRKGRRVLVRAL